MQISKNGSKRSTKMSSTLKAAVVRDPMAPTATGLIACFTLATLTLLTLANCAPKDRAYGLSAPGFQANALGLQDQSPQYMRHSLASLDHARQTLEIALANPAPQSNGCHGVSRSTVSTQSAGISANPKPPQQVPPEVQPAQAAQSPAVPAPAVLNANAQDDSSLIVGRVDSLLLKYNNCTEKSALVSRATQTGQEFVVVSYTNLDEQNAVAQVMPSSVAVQTDLRYELDRVGSKYDKVYINQVASLTYAKVSETDAVATYKVSYDARESFDLDVQLTRRFGQLNPTFINAVFVVDKATRKVKSLGSPKFTVFANVEQWVKADPKGTSLSSKKTDRANLTITAQGDLSVSAVRCQLPEGNLDLKSAASGGAQNAAASDDDVTHFTSAAGKLTTDAGVTVDQGLCAAGSSNLDAQQAGFLGDFEPLFMN